MRRRQQLFTVMASAIVALSSAACDDIFGTNERDDLRSAERRWAREGPRSYSYVLHRSCFCAIEVVRPVRIVVENGIVISRHYEDTGEPVLPPWDDAFPAIEGVFQVIHDALSNDADVLDARYHSRLGYPIEVDIDYITNAIDDELRIEVSELRPR